MSFDVLVVLGCRVRDGQLSQAALRRVERAARAYHEHGAALVIASGGKSWQGFRECEVFARGLVERGVLASQILEERASLTTRGNAHGVARLLDDRPGRRLGLVTCDWHMPRALRVFARLGLSASPLAAPSPARPWHVVCSRLAREHVSLALDLLLSPLRPRS